MSKSEPVAVGAAHAAGRHDGVAPVVVAEGGQGPVQAKPLTVNIRFYAETTQ